MELHGRSIHVVNNPAFDPSSNLILPIVLLLLFSKKQMMAARRRLRRKRNGNRGSEGSLSGTG
jgi:hypothetical protein